MKKIMGITSIRSDYDLMSGLYQLLDTDADIDLRLLVSGAHLSPTFGNTVELIKKDGFTILAEIDSLINSDSAKSRVKTASIMLQNAIDIVAAWQPDVIIYAGDREDVLVGGMLGTFLGIPTIHFFGGDHETDGHADTMIRHATSKLSSFHIVSIEQHKQRLLKMGEAPERIFVAGSIALDKFVDQSNKTTRIPVNKKFNQYALLIFHPVEEDGIDSATVFENILIALKHAGIPAMVSYPNSDPGNQAIIEKIHQYENDPHFWFYKNLERDVFLSLYSQAQFLIGNSSSGIMEAASLQLGVINVGHRQRGRYCEKNVVFCGTGEKDITDAIGLVTSSDFQSSLQAIQNPYGDGQSCQKAYDVIRSTDFSSLVKKTEDPLEMN